MRINPSFLLNVVLAVALVCVCVQLARKEHPSTISQSPADAIYANITTRSSVRSYIDKPVEDGKIDTLLHAGMAAPSAVNRQPWEFVVVNDRKLLQQIAQLTPNAAMASEAPLAIVACGDMSKYKPDENRLREFWVQDLSAATENILLQAHALGLGAVWTGTYPSEERCAAISQLLKLPEHIVPLCTIVIGYPKGEQHPKDKWNAENVSYNYFGVQK